MKVSVSLYFLLLLCGMLGSCKNDTKTKAVDEAEVRFRYYTLEKQGWKSKNHNQKAGNVSYTATEVPIQYYLLKDDPDQNLEIIDSIYNANKRERVIEFVFQDENEEDLLAEKFTGLTYKKAVEYMSFAIQKDFVVVTTKHDTVQCSGSLFERTFKVAPGNKLLLFFSNIDPYDKIQLVYRDNLFKKGTLKFRFKEPVLNL